MSLQSYVFELNSPTIVPFFYNKRGVSRGLRVLKSIKSNFF